MAIGKRISPEVICETATYNDTSTHNLITYTLPDGITVMAEAVIMGKDASNNPIVAKKILAGEKTLGNAATGIVSSIVADLINLSNAGATATIVLSGANVIVQVKGPTIAKAIEWQAELKIYIN